jgi:hypothetical protein
MNMDDSAVDIFSAAARFSTALLCGGALARQN